MSDRARYGYAHRKLRKQWEPIVADGGVDCARCNEPIEPGTPWDLGHVAGSATEYAGPMHQRCNRNTMAEQRELVATVREFRWFV
jgi:hypothetical protein